MRKTKRTTRRTAKRWVIGMLLLTLVITRIAQFQVKAAENEDAIPSTICTDGEQLLSAVDAASDGDIIGISGNIIVTTTNNRNVGADTRRITIKRMTPDACITFQNTNETSIFLRNITFDGGGINKQCNPLVTVDANVYFIGSIFKNCNTELQGAAVNIISGYAEMEKCLFFNNYAESGGHIAITNDCELVMFNSTLINGQAEKCGGAIYVDNNESYLLMNDCTITGNKSTWGGGIFNNGLMTMNGCVIYDNGATVGGADILNASSLCTKPCESIDNVVVHYGAVKLIPLEWVNDYNGGELPEGVDPEKANTFMQMRYEVIETESGENNQDDTGSEETPPETGETDNPDESGESSASQDTDGTNTNDTENTQNPDKDDSGDEQSTTQTPEENNNPDTDIEDDSPGTSSEDAGTTPNNNTPITEDNSKTITDNSTTTTNNYSYLPESGTASQPQAVTTTGVTTNKNDETDVKTVTETPLQETNQSNNQGDIALQQNNIRVEVNGVDFVFEMIDGNISIVAGKEEQPDQLEQTVQPEQVADIPEVTSTEEPEESEKEIEWLQLIQTILLIALFICVLYKPGKGKNLLENKPIE